MNDRERVQIHEIHGQVHDGVEAEVEARAAVPSENGEPHDCGLWVRDDPDNADVDDPVRDHLGRPVADWQKRPVPWEYTSKAQYRRDLQKFMEEVYGDSGN